VPTFSPANDNHSHVG